MWFSLLVFAAARTFVAAQQTDRLPQVDTAFRREIEPIFKQHCHSCHGPEKQKGGLRLDQKSRAFAGGDSGAAFIPGKSAESRLFKYIAGLDPEIVMPPKGDRLTSQETDLVKRWIDGGAIWPDDAPFATDDSQNRATQHWAFRPPQRPKVPTVQNTQWVINPIDAFVAAQHEARALVPSKEAPRRTLLRRVAFDLTGLPPQPEEIDEFLGDAAPDAYERMVERYLSSPHYGERWGRHWLDLARWAETDGYEANELRVAAWRYRDYVVKSFNSDKPYDRFLREQIAGDELVPYSDEHLIATGFLAAGRLNNNEEDKSVQRNESLVDIVNATASVTLGLTLACAQCHDHKFDPLTARDYYRFQAFFLKGQVNTLLLKDPNLWAIYQASIPSDLEASKTLRKLISDPIRARLIEEARQKLPPESLEALNTPAEKRTAEQKELAQKAQRELNIGKDKIEKALNDDDRRLLQELEKKITKTEKQLEERKPQLWGFYSPVTSPHAMDALPPRGMYPLPYDRNKLKDAKPHLLKRGDVHRPGVELTAGWPEVLGPTPDISIGKTPRLVLADWLTSGTNALVARVWVNYLWQQHFGRGIVETAGDFGVRGAKPSHPELLDWLATEFVRSGWSTKEMHRLILLSKTYRQGSKSNAANAKTDPDNKYLWRWSVRRLEAEAIRDGALAVSGELDRTVGGPSIATEQESSQLRRGLYLRQKRHALPAMQMLFDSPTGNESCPQRHVSTVSLQPLYMLNNEFFLKRAESFAGRVLRKGEGNQDRQIEKAFVLALGRLPEETERKAASALLNQQESASEKSWVHFCHALLNLNEFVYLE